MKVKPRRGTEERGKKKAGSQYGWLHKTFDEGKEIEGHGPVQLTLGGVS